MERFVVIMVYVYYSVISVSVMLRFMCWCIGYNGFNSVIASILIISSVIYFSVLMLLYLFSRIRD